MLKNCTALWREAHFQVKMFKTHHSRTTLGSWDVEKLHAAVARSTFQSQNAQNAPCSDHFLKLRCQTTARRCSEKHICKSKYTKHTILGPFLEVGMWKNCAKNCTPLWRELFSSKCAKRTMFGPLFEVGMWKNGSGSEKHICKSKC